jgi:excisionase family DNA binding protein
MGENLRKSRELLGLSREEVASRIGITQNRLSRIENAIVDPSVSELIALCNALKVTPAAIFIKTTRSIRSKVTKQSIEEFMTIKETAAVLGVAEQTITKLCKNKEIPHAKIGKAFLFRWTEINDWLDIQFNKQLTGKAKQRVINGERYGIEPLIGAREIKDIFGGLLPTDIKQDKFIPTYRIGNRKKYRLTDVLAYISQSSVSIYDVPVFGGCWDTRDFNRTPSVEEMAAKRLERRLSYNSRENVTPGYEWAYNSFTCDTVEEAEDRINDFRQVLEHKWLLGEAKVDWTGKSCKVDLRYMRVPAFWAGYRVIRSTRSADYPNQVKIKTLEFLSKNVPKERIIKVTYYTDTFFGIRPPKHCSTISYYAPVENKLASDPGTILNPKAKKQYEKLIEESMIRVPKRIMEAIEQLKSGDLTSGKLTHILREANLFDPMNEAGLIVFGERREIIDVKMFTERDKRKKRPFHGYWDIGIDKPYRRLVEMSPEEDTAYEEEREQRKQREKERMQRVAAYHNENRRIAVERVEQNYQDRLRTFGGSDKADLIRNALAEEDWNRLVWLQKYWDQLLLSDGRKRGRSIRYDNWEEFNIKIFDINKLIVGWKVTDSYRARDVFERLIKAGAIFCQIYSGIVEINPCLSDLLKEATGEDKEPNGWRSKLASSGAKVDTFLRPDSKLLSELAEKYSNVTLGKVFGISDVAIKKWLRKDGLKRTRRVANMNITEEEIKEIREHVKRTSGIDIS